MHVVASTHGTFDLVVGCFATSLLHARPEGSHNEELYMRGWGDVGNFPLTQQLTLELREALA